MRFDRPGEEGGAGRPVFGVEVAGAGQSVLELRRAAHGVLEILGYDLSDELWAKLRAMWSKPKNPTPPQLLPFTGQRPEEEEEPDDLLRRDELALLGFVGTVVLSKHLLRGDIAE